MFVFFIKCAETLITLIINTQRRLTNLYLKAKEHVDKIDKGCEKKFTNSGVRYPSI